MKRLTSFDIAKAIALCAVVFGHCSFGGAPRPLVDCAYSFSMPTFFFISGYFCREEKLDATYVRKNFRSLIIPYVLTSIILITLCGLRAAILPGEGHVFTTMRSWVVAVLYGSGGVFPGMPEGVIAVGAIWYLLALFWAKLLLASIREMKYPGLLSLILFIVGVQTKEAVWLPLSVQPALCAVLFMYVGQEARRFSLFDKGRVPFLLWVCIVMTWLYCAAFYGQLYMVSNTYQHGAIDVIGGICGAMLMIKVGEGMAKARYLKYVESILAWIGRNTPPLFCMHLVVLNVVPWDYVFVWCGENGIAVWKVMLIIHTFFSALLTGLLYIMPKPVARAFFPKAKATASR